MDKNKEIRQNMVNRVNEIVNPAHRDLGGLESALRKRGFGAEALAVQNLKNRLDAAHVDFYNYMEQRIEGAC